MSVDGGEESSAECVQCIGTSHAFCAPADVTVRSATDSWDL